MDNVYAQLFCMVAAGDCILFIVPLLIRTSLSAFIRLIRKFCHYENNY